MGKLDGKVVVITLGEACGIGAATRAVGYR
jgi:hypothetical protein